MAHHYTLTYQDFKDAQVLCRKHRPAMRYQMLALFGGFPLATVVLLGCAAWLGSHGHAGNAIGWYAAGGWFAFMSIMFYVMRPLQMRRLFRKSLPDGQETADVEFSFGEEGVRSAIAGRSEGRFFWSAIQDYAEDEKLALLFIKKKLFFYLPKRAMPPEEWEQLRSYVREKTGRR